MVAHHLLKNRKGFTLIELLVVIGILALLLAITLVAINPAKQFSQSNNTKRSSDVNAILNAINQYSVDHKGDISAIGIPSSPSAAMVIGSGPGQLNFCPNIVPTYIAEMPVDPQTGTWVDCTDYNSGYSVIQASGDQRVTVIAPGAELGQIIQVTR